MLFIFQYFLSCVFLSLWLQFYSLLWVGTYWSMQTINDHLVASICIHFGFTLRLFYLLRFFPTVVGLAASFLEDKTQSLCTIFTLPLWFTRHTRTQGLQRIHWLNIGVLPGALSSLLPCNSWLEESLSLLASWTLDSLIANTGKQVFVLFILLKGTSSLVSSRRFLPCVFDVILPHEYINGCSILVCNVENKIKLVYSLMCITLF